MSDIIESVDIVSISVTESAGDVLVVCSPISETVTINLTSPIDGKQIELQGNNTTNYIQWRYVGEYVWNDLISYSAISDSEIDGGASVSVFDTITDDYNCGGA